MTLLKLRLISTTPNKIERDVNVELVKFIHPHLHQTILKWSAGGDMTLLCWELGLRMQVLPTKVHAATTDGQFQPHSEFSVHDTMRAGFSSLSHSLTPSHALESHLQQVRGVAW